MRYKRRPVEVDAVLWNGSEGAREELEKMLGGPSLIGEKGLISIAGVTIPFGLWIIRTASGSVRAYPPKEFEARFEPVAAGVDA